MAKQENPSAKQKADSVRQECNTVKAENHNYYKHQLSLGKAAKSALDIVYPRRCPVCGDIVPYGEGYIHRECRAFPVYAGSDVCSKCGRILGDTTREYCSSCETSPAAHYICGRGLFLHDRYLSQMIYELKYCNHREYVDYFADEIAGVYGNLIRKWGVDLIVPVPVHISRIRERGYNQTFLLARALSVLTGIPVMDCLVRTRRTIRQKDLSHSQRSRNMKGIFRCRLDMKPVGNVLLIDDIYTTGSTINNCSLALKAAGVNKVYFITISIGRED